MGVLMESSQANHQRADLRYCQANSNQTFPYGADIPKHPINYADGYSPIKEAGLDYSVRFVPSSKDDAMAFPVVCSNYQVSNYDRINNGKSTSYIVNGAVQNTLSPFKFKKSSDANAAEDPQQREVCGVDGAFVKAEHVAESKNGFRRPGSPARMPPPKKKWMKNYMEEEPCDVLVQQIRHNQVQQQQQPRNGLTVLGSCLTNGSTTTSNNANAASSHSVSNGLTTINSSSRAPPPSAPISIPPSHHAPPSAAALHLLDHDQPRARSNSNGSGGVRAAGTREVHNKLEKNRRAHLKECFELLKKQLPATSDDKKSSNLSILDSAIRYIQSLKRRERECEHEMERLAREKIAFQQRVASLRQGMSPVTPTLHLPSNHDRETMSEGDEPMMTSRMSPLIMTSPRSASSLSMSLPEHSSNGLISTSSSPSSLDLSTRQIHHHQQLRPAAHHSLPHATLSQPLQVLTSQSGTTTMYIEQASSPNHTSPNITRIQPHQQQQANSIITTQQIIASPFQQSQHIVNSIVGTPGTLNLTVNPSIKTARGPSKGVIAPGLPTLTVTTVNHGPVMAVNPNNVQPRQTVQSMDRKILTTVPSSVNGQTTIVHPAQLHLPISQVMNGSGLVMSPAIQMIYATPQTLRMLQGQGGAIAPVDLPSTAANTPIARHVREVQKMIEPGVGGATLTTTAIVSNGRTTATFPAGSVMTQAQINQSNGNHMTSQPHHLTLKTQPENAKTTLHTLNSQTQIMMNGLTPLLMSKGGTHIITAPQHLAGKVVSAPILKAQYLGAAGTVKPVVVVSTGNGLPIQHSQAIVPSSITVTSSSSASSTS